MKLKILLAVFFAVLFSADIYAGTIISAGGTTIDGTADIDNGSKAISGGSITGSSGTISGGLTVSGTLSATVSDVAVSSAGINANANVDNGNYAMDGGSATIRGIIKTGNGSISAPSYSFIDDPDTGIYRIGTDMLGITAGATKAAEFSSTGTVVLMGTGFDFQVLASNGRGMYLTQSDLNFGWRINSAFTPTINYYGYQGGTTQTRNLDIYDGKGNLISSFSPSRFTTYSHGSFDTIYSSNGIQMSVGSVAKISSITCNATDFNLAITTNIITNGNIYIPDGTVTAPSITFAGNKNTGFYRVGANNVGVTSGGNTTMQWSSGRTRIPDGTLANLTFSFINETDSGFYRNSAGNFGFAVTGVQIATFTATGITVGGNFDVQGSTFVVEGGLAKLPSYTAAQLALKTPDEVDYTAWTTDTIDYYISTGTTQGAFFGVYSRKGPNNP